MHKHISFWFVVSVVFAVAFASPVAPEVESVADVENTQASWTGLDPWSDAGHLTKEALARGGVLEAIYLFETDNDLEAGDLETNGLENDEANVTEMMSPSGGLDRIVGGYRTEIRDHPHLVSIHHRGIYCGGSIINRNWVLTAAHCIRGGRSQYIIRAGSSFRNSRGVRFKVSDIRVHSLYNSRISDYDIALMRVNRPFRFGRFIKPIRLANYSPQTGTSAIIAGWGSTSTYGKASKYLRAASVKIMSQSTCMKFSPRNFVPSRMICAGTPSGGRGTCDGDSGGPLVSRGEQVGIVSHRQQRECARKPTVYTSVAYYRKWIKRIAGV